MKMHETTGQGFCESVAHFMTALLEQRDFAAVVKQYELHRSLLDDVGGSAAGTVLHRAATAYASLGNYPMALRVARLAQAMIAAEGDSLLLAEIFVTLGGVLRDLGQLKEAEKAFRDAESIFRRKDHLEGQSRALNHLAGLYYRQTDYRNALAVLMDAVEIAQKNGDKKKLAFMMGNIGRIHTFTGDMAEAEKHLKINIDLSLELGDQIEVARAYLSFAYVYIQQADYASAEQALGEAYPRILISVSKRDEVIYYTYLGELQYRAGRLEESRVALERALHLAEEIGPNTTLAARVLRHLAELAIRTKNHRLAQRYVAKAIPVFQKADDKVEMGALWKLKAQIADMTEQKEESVASFKRALDLLAESGVRWEKAEALVAAGCSRSFSARERMTYLFRAEEFYARCHMVRKHDEIGRLIHEQDDRMDVPNLGPIPKSAVDTEYYTNCEKIKQFKAQIPILGRSDLPILLTGETGVGKDRLASYFHSVVRPGTRYVAINCASIPETLLESELFGYRKGAFTGAQEHKDGLFVEANGGVLLLDEIGDMPLALQVKLLSVLEHRRLTPLGGTKEVELDIKIVVATNQNLEEMVEQGRFRRDLYYRLSGLSFHIPALRERKEDIPLLLQTFMRKRKMCGDGQKLPAELVRQFLEYDWPGNIRELDNKVKRLEVMAQMVAEGDLVELARTIFAPTKQLPDKGNLFDRVEEYERQLIMDALMAAHGNKCEAARLLGVHEATVRMKLKRYGTHGTMH